MKNKISRLGVSLISGAGLLFLSFVRLAQAQPGPTSFGNPGAQLPTGGNNVSFTTISGALCTLVAWIFTILIILAVIFILWAAWLYLNSGGEEEKIRKANHQLLYAAIAIIVAILSRGVPFLINTVLGNSSTLNGC